VSELQGTEDNEAEALSLLIARASTQHSTWDSIDNKTMWIFGLSVAVLALFLASVSNAETGNRGWYAVLAWACLTLTVVAAVLAYREYFPEEIATYVSPAQVMKDITKTGATRLWCEGVAATIEQNREPLKRKARLLAWCTRLVGLQLLLTLFGAATLV